MQILCHVYLYKGLWTSVDFGIFGGPRPNPTWMPGDYCTMLILATLSYLNFISKSIEEKKVQYLISIYQTQWQSSCRGPSAPVTPRDPHDYGVVFGLISLARCALLDKATQGKSQIWGNLGKWNASEGGWPSSPSFLGTEGFFPGLRVSVLEVWNRRQVRMSWSPYLKGTLNRWIQLMLKAGVGRAGRGGWSGTMNSKRRPFSFIPCTVGDPTSLNYSRRELQEGRFPVKPRLLSSEGKTCL